MCYGDHLYTDRNLSVDDVTAKDIPARACLKVGPDRGRARDQSDRAVHFLNKCLSHLEAPSKVPFEGVIDFPESFRVELGGAGAGEWLKSRRRCCAQAHLDGSQGLPAACRRAPAAGAPGQERVSAAPILAGVAA